MDKLDLVALNEAHILSEASRGFREEARLIRSMRESNMLGDSPFYAMTATASNRDLNNMLLTIALRKEPGKHKLIVLIILGKFALLA